MELRFIVEFMILNYWNLEVNLRNGIEK